LLHGEGQKKKRGRRRRNAYRGSRGRTPEETGELPNGSKERQDRQEPAPRAGQRLLEEGGSAVLRLNHRQRPEGRRKKKLGEDIRGRKRTTSLSRCPSRKDNVDPRNNKRKKEQTSEKMGARCMEGAKKTVSKTRPRNCSSSKKKKKK